MSRGSGEEGPAGGAPRDPSPDRSAARAPQETGGGRSPLADALLSARKSQILRELAERGPMSASGLARVLGLPQSSVNEHVRQLREAGLLAETDTVRRRNALERRFYPTEAAKLLGGEDWEELAPREKRRLITALFRFLQERLSQAMKANSGDFSPDSLWTVAVHTLDGQGLEELQNLHHSCLAETARIVDGAKARLEVSGGPEVRACSTQLLFEMPATSESGTAAGQ